jgi:hypothetical protein
MEAGPHDFDEDWRENPNWFESYAHGQPGVIPAHVNPIVVYVRQTPLFPEVPPPGWGTTRTLMVNLAVKQLIESLEPNLHDFVPVELRYVESRAYSREDFSCFVAFPYFHARVDRILRAVDQSKSDIKIFRPGEWMKKTDRPLIQNRSAISGLHLWRENTHLFCSNELRELLASLRLDGGWTFEQQEVA